MLTSIITKRKALKITQAEMAKLLNVRRETYINMEKKGTITLSDFKIICDRLGLFCLILPVEILPITEIKSVKQEHVVAPVVKGNWRERLNSPVRK